jgi:hypothetical protein
MIEKHVTWNITTGTIAQTLCFVQLFRSVGAVCKQFGNASKISGLLSTNDYPKGEELSRVHLKSSHEVKDDREACHLEHHNWDTFMGRPILSRQKRFGFYRPTAFAIANAITDVPVVTAPTDRNNCTKHNVCAIMIIQKVKNFPASI